MASDQMPGGTLTAEQAAPFLASGDSALVNAAAWIVSQHADWGGALAGYFRTRLTSAKLSPEERRELEEQLAQLSSAPEIQELLAASLGEDSATRDERLSVLRSMSLAKPKTTPSVWIAALEKSLGSNDVEIVTSAVAAIRALPLTKETGEPLVGPLLEAAAARGAPDELREAALAAVPGGLRQVSSQTLAFLLEQLDPEHAVSTRLAAVEVLSKATLTGEQLKSLADALKEVGPLEVERLLSAFEQTTDEEVGLKLIAALGDSAALTALRSETLKQRLAKYGAPVHKQAEQLYARLDVGIVEQKAILEKLLASLPAGDHRRGQAVFNSTKAACASCHAIGYLGGKLGPDLTRVGQIRNERDLLEAIVYPSVSLVRSFEPMVIIT